MKKTKIDWADSTWNPVTGCLHDCEYCYARKIAERFAGYEEKNLPKKLDDLLRTSSLVALGEPKRKADGKAAPYPYGFTPTLHRYRMDEPERWTKPRTIFVCSMADLFGDWVPDEWIKQVFEACEAAPQHRYLFLTKNPTRILRLASEDKLPNYNNFWFGTTITTPEQPFFLETPFFTNNSRSHSYGIFLSIEPIQEDFPVQDRLARIPGRQQNGVDWIIVGAETGNRKDKIYPNREWIEHIAETSEKTGIPLFMKESLRDLMGDDFRQEFPWPCEVRK